MAGSLGRRKGMAAIPAWRHAKAIYFLIAAAAICYPYLNYLEAHNTDSTSASAAKLFFISSTVAVPLIVVWIIAAVGVVRFKRYASSIKGSEDGKGLQFIANALLLMLLYVVLLSVTSSAVTLFRGSAHLDTAISLKNHIPIVVVLCSAVLLLRGSMRLKKIPAASMFSRKRWTVILVLYGLFAVFFIWNFYRIAPDLVPQGGIPRFALSTNMLLFTYIIPHLAVWLLGLTACLNIADYSLMTKGSVYRRLFRNLYRGILLVFICTFLAQLFIISNVNLDRFSISLILIYGLLILGAIGFILINRGTKQMAKIEWA